MSLALYLVGALIGLFSGGLVLLCMISEARAAVRVHRARRRRPLGQVIELAPRASRRGSR